MRLNSYFSHGSHGQVCYRVLMQLCGQYGHPALAVKVSIIAVVCDTGRVNVCTFVYVGTKEQHLRLLLFFCLSQVRWLVYRIS